MAVRGVVTLPILALVAAGAGSLFSLATASTGSAGGGHPARPAAAATASPTTSSVAGWPRHSPAPAPKPVQRRTAAAARHGTAPQHPAAAATVTLAGCPVPPQPPSPPPPPPWHPDVLVPASALPPVVTPAPWKSDVGPITGKGMWIWTWSETDGGSARAIVEQAVRAGVHSLWVRVGDSLDGFYGAPELAALVPLAHANGLTVIAWGFPYLYDPLRDAAWAARALDWRGPGGQRVDGFSADIERPTEGVDLTAQRAAVYLEAVRHAAGSRLVVATTYPPLDAYWFGDYPYRAMAPYVDAFAPMIYWECTDPGADAIADVARLSTLHRPVDIIGQAFSMASIKGRAPSPSGAEITEFMADGRKAGAVGASFWVWQDATAQEWAALAAYRWHPR